jgi:hypothetical protein
MGGAGGGPDAAAEASDKPAVLLLLEQLAFEHPSGIQALYHDGGNAHNCTTHDFQ